jgi:hypothetical protein
LTVERLEVVEIEVEVVGEEILVVAMTAEIEQHAVVFARASEEAAHRVGDACSRRLLVLQQYDVRRIGVLAQQSINCYAPAKLKKNLNPPPFSKKNCTFVLYCLK